MKKLEISERDTRDILIYAFRYTLGRSTYSVSTMATILKDNTKSISNADLKLFMREINEAIEMEICGMDIDCRTWKHLLEFMKIELDKR